MKNTKVIRLTESDLNNIINETVSQLLKEGFLDNMKSGFDNAKNALSRFADGYEVKEGNPQSIEDVFEGDGWKIIAAVPKQSSTFYLVSRQTGAFGAFNGIDVNGMVEELNTFLGGNYAKYIGKHPEKKYIEVFRIEK